MTRRDWQRSSVVHVCWQAWGLGGLLWVCSAGAVAQELTPWTNGPTPLLALTDQRGIHHTLTAYGGRVVLVHFWTTWCELCREEMPVLQALQNKIGQERCVVLAVNYGELPAKVQPFVHTIPVDFPVLLDRWSRTCAMRIMFRDCSQTPQVRATSRSPALKTHFQDLISAVWPLSEYTSAV